MLILEISALRIVMALFCIRVTLVDLSLLPMNAITALVMYLLLGLVRRRWRLLIVRWAFVMSFLGRQEESALHRPMLPILLRLNSGPSQPQRVNPLPSKMPISLFPG